MLRIVAPVLLTAAIAFASDPWTQAQTLTTNELAAEMEHGKAPVILMVGPRILYNGGHIRGAKYAGPTGGEAGLRVLRQQLSGISKDAEIVVYCGCCPMEKCPNIRPAFEELRRNEYRNSKALIVPVNLYFDWTSKGYPVEKGEVVK